MTSKVIQSVYTAWSSNSEDYHKCYIHFQVNIITIHVGATSYYNFIVEQILRYKTNGIFSRVQAQPTGPIQGTLSFGGCRMYQKAFWTQNRKKL